MNLSSFIPRLLEISSNKGLNRARTALYMELILCLIYEASQPYSRGHVAQWIARWTSDPEVVGSSPTVIEFFFFVYLCPSLVL